MGLLPGNPTFWEIVLLQIVAFIILAFLPIIWIMFILTGLVMVLVRLSSAEAALNRTGDGISTFTLVPFYLTWAHCIIFGARFVVFVYKTVGREPPAWARARSLGGVWPYMARSRNSETLHPQPLHPDPLHPDPLHPEPDRRDASLTKHRKPYRYSPLKGVDDFRLLIIFPGSFNESLRGELVTTSLSGIRRPAYDALSYTWADETGDADRSRQFHCQRDGSTIQITKNCEAAMRNLRLSDRKRWLWIDAICINQDSYAERTHQVSIMSSIFTSARRVVVYTGEGTAQTDILFDWLNGLNTEDLDFPSRWDFDHVTGDVLINLTRYWNVGRERLLALIRDPGVVIAISESELIDLVKEYFSRRWFKRVWVLQEVTLPDIRNITVICGTKATNAVRALHALSLLHKDSSASMIRIFVLLRKRTNHPKTSHLLDILIETRDREAQDPRDKIFGVLSISNALDGGKFLELEADYAMATQEVYAYYSALFIQYHGPGFFLSLIKSPPTLAGLPSWSADWTAPWPNYNAVRERDFAACSRLANNNDGGAIFDKENGYHVLTLSRSRILRGYFTRNGHLDGSTGIHIAGLESLGEDDVLIEMYPGLAALLKKEKESEYYVFIQICPHALSEIGIGDLVRRWNSVVLDTGGPIDQIGQDSRSHRYLSPVEIFKIR